MKTGLPRNLTVSWLPCSTAERSTWIEASACTSALGFIWLTSGHTAAAAAMPPAAPVATNRKSLRVPEGSSLG